jgi:tetratricopeptide (TPR) repeat protein
MEFFPPLKKVTFLATALLVIASVAPVCAATKHRARASSQPGGVMLQTPEPNTPEEHNNRGVELGNKGLWPDAIREHELALQADPGNQTFRTNLSAAQLRYGDLLASRKDYYNAAKQYRGALYVDASNGPADDHLDECIKRSGKNPLDINVRRGMADAADTSGDYETAIVEYGKCVRMVDDGPSHAQLGRVYLKANKNVEGFKELKAAVSKSWEGKDKKDLADVHRQLGDILKEYAFLAKEKGRGTIGMKRLLNAGTEYRRAVTINPLNTSAIQGLIEVSREAVAISPTAFDNHLMLAGAYELAGDFDHAQMEYTECFNINPDNPVLVKARRSYYTSIMRSPLASPKMVTETLQKLEPQLAKNPNDAELLYIYGRGKEAQGDRETALAAYNRAQGIDPYVNADLEQGVSRLGGTPVIALNAPTTQGQAQQAQAEKKAAAPPPPSPEKVLADKKAADDALKAQQSYADVEGKIRAGDIDGAQKQLLALVENNHSDAHAWLLLGNTQEKKNELDEAAVSYRQASNLKDPAADEALRQINTSRVQPMLESADKSIKENNMVAAASSLREALSIAPDLSSVHRKLADVLKQLGDTKEADRELKKATEIDQKK